MRKRPLEVPIQVLHGQLVHAAELAPQPEVRGLGLGVGRAPVDRLHLPTPRSLLTDRKVLDGVLPLTH